MAGEHLDRPRADRPRQRPPRRLRAAVMTGVAATLAKARGENRAALVGYLPVGFPDVDGSIEAMVAMVESGARQSVDTSRCSMSHWSSSAGTNTSR